MIKKLSVIIIFCLLASCKSTPEVDLSDTRLTIFPSRVFVPVNNTDFSFTKKERLKAKREAKKRRYDILYEVYVNKDSSVRSVKLIKKTRYADSETVAKIRHQIKQKGFFKSLGTNSAFFYGVTVRAEIEYM